MASRLSAAARQRAVDFIGTYGTNLIQQRYLFHFESGSSENVIAALGHYQNNDGGFGHGLEADLRTRHSSVIATTVALQVITEINGWQAPIARRAIGYLEQCYNQGNWPLIGPECNDAPHAPWWQWTAPPDPDRFHANPGAEVLSYLYSACAMGETTRAELMARALKHIASNDLEMHELLCYLRLMENPKLPARHRDELLPHLLTQAFALVKVNVHDWEEYGLSPMAVVSRPESPLRDFFGPALDECFDHYISRQNDDGSWSPAWSWGNSFPEAWRTAEREIRGTLTLQCLLQLKHFDLLD